MSDQVLYHYTTAAGLGVAVVSAENTTKMLVKEDFHYTASDSDLP